MQKKTFTRFFAIALVMCLVMALIPANVALANDGSVLQEAMEYLVKECGQRLYGSPNEDKAAAYIKAKFESFGYENVDWAKIDQRSVNYVGRLVFADGAADVLGNAYPANPNAGEFGETAGKLVAVGTTDAIVIPEGTAGDIIAAVKFTGSVNGTNVEKAIADIKAASPAINLKGLLITTPNSTSVPRASQLTAPTVPCVVTTELFFDTAVENADDFSFMERYTKTQTNAVIATKPAATDDPDAIIIVTSHMDCVLATAGASDNASGVAANLELARRFATIDNGNIEIRFAAVGAEDGGGMLGSIYVRDTLSEEQKAIAINMNMDMLCSDQPASGGSPLNAVSIDINPRPLAFNLPAFLVTDGAKDVEWAEGIDNVRIYRYGSSDHVKFDEVGIEAGSMIIVTNEDDDIESMNHRANDTLEGNYSYDRLLMCTNLMANGIQKAIDSQMSKKAEVTFTDMEEGTKATLTNAKQLFKLYDKVVAKIAEKANPEAVTEVTFTPGKQYADGLALAADAYEVVEAYAYGTGNADNLDKERNETYKEFKTKLRAASVVGPDPAVPRTNVNAEVDPSYTIVVPAKIEFGSLKKNSGIVTKEFSVTAQDVMLEAGQSIVVTVAPVTGDAFVMTDGAGTELPFGVENADGAVQAGGTFATFTTDGEATGVATLDTSLITAAGAFAGVINFTATLA